MQGEKMMEEVTLVNYNSHSLEKLTKKMLNYSVCLLATLPKGSA
jgi:hypothetical protein